MSWIERRLDELAADGYFENLPGSGRPISDVSTEYSPSWWIARWVKRDSVRAEAAAVRRRLVSDIAAALALERPDARRRLIEIKTAIAEINSHLDSTEHLPDFDVDTVLIHGKWR